MAEAEASVAESEESTSNTKSAATGLLRAAWNKYGLIVVGNVVFFVLLYFFTYRPNNRDNRAAELLRMAQTQENESHWQASEVLYAKILADYTETDAAGTARARLPKVQARVKKEKQTQPPLPAACAPTVDVKEVLEQKPAFFLAELLGAYYPEVQPAERKRFFSVLDGYVSMSFNRDGVPFRQLKSSEHFRDEELQKRYFTIKGSAYFNEDYIYDDFKVKNTSFFTLHNAIVELTVKQAGDSETESIRVPALAPGKSVEVLQFGVSEDGGPVEVKGKILSDEGEGTWTQRL